MSTATPTNPSPAAVRGPPDEAAMKARIIGHMNSDHALSLRLYLVHYLHVPFPATKSAKMLDITNQHMVLESVFGRHVVEIVPEMKSLMEARERLVAMHQECLAKTGLSDVVVDEYKLPDRAWAVGLMGLVVLILATFPLREALRPESGSIVAQIWSLGGAVPALARLCYTLQPFVLATIVLVHGVEAAWFANSRLKTHWVDVGTGVWWAWMIDILLEGSGGIMRFQRLVNGKEEEKKGKKGGKH